MSKTTARLIVSLTLLVISAGFLSVTVISITDKTSNLTACLLKQRNQLSQRVIDSEANCIVQAAISSSESTLLAAEQIRILLTENGKPVLGCHILGHAIGRNMSKRLGTVAIVLGQSWCEDSYYHGLMAQEMQNSKISVADLAERICAVISAPNALRAVDPNLCNINMAHGVGHAIYSNKNSLDKSYRLCQSLPETQHEQCGYGVVMEQLIQAGVNINVPELADKNFCMKIQTADLSAGCYSGITELAVARGANMNDICDTAKGWAKTRCAYSFGSYLAIAISTESLALGANQLELCAESDSCARGLGDMRFLWGRNVEDANSFCKQVLGGGTTMKACIRGVELAVSGRSGIEETKTD